MLDGPNCCLNSLAGIVAGLSSGLPGVRAGLQSHFWPGARLGPQDGLWHSGLPQPQGVWPWVQAGFRAGRWLWPPARVWLRPRPRVCQGVWISQRNDVKPWRRSAGETVPSYHISFVTLRSGPWFSSLRDLRCFCSFAQSCLSTSLEVRL